MTEGIYDLFESVNTPHYSNAEGSQRIADRIDVHRFDYRPELEGVRVAIFGVLDGRRSGDNEGCGAAPQAVRECLYRLTPHSSFNWVSSHSSLVVVKTSRFLSIKLSKPWDNQAKS